MCRKNEKQEDKIVVTDGYDIINIRTLIKTLIKTNPLNGQLEITIEDIPICIYEEIDLDELGLKDIELKGKAG